MREKPKLERYYQNLKTGQYAKLEGSPLAIKNIETHQWPRFQKVRVKRIPKREFYKNVPKERITWSYGCPFSPERRRKGKKSNAPAFHIVDFRYWPT